MKLHKFRFLGLGALCIVTVLAIEGCRYEEAPSRSFLSSELLLQLDDLPAHWESQGPPERLDVAFGMGDEDDSVVGFSIDGVQSTALNYIYQEPTKTAAIRLYDKQVVALFRDQSIVRNVPWSVPSELSFNSPYTDRMHMECTVVAGSEVCRAIAQYEEYVIVFSSAVGEDGMTISEFNEILEAIDQKFATVLALQPRQAD